MFIFDNVSNKQEKNTPKDHACQGICYTFVEKYNFPKELYVRCVEQNHKVIFDYLFKSSYMPV